MGIFNKIRGLVKGSKRTVPTPADRDQAIFRLLAGNGADLTQPRHTLFYLYFPTQEAATQAQEELMGHWLASEPEFVAAVPAEPLAGTWPCRVEARMVVNEEVIRTLSQELEAIASRHGGEYDGWECAV